MFGGVKCSGGGKGPAVGEGEGPPDMFAPPLTARGGDSGAMQVVLGADAVQRRVPPRWRVLCSKPLVLSPPVFSGIRRRVRLE